MARIQAIGVTRFSYLCEGGFQVVHDSLAARHAFLFQPERIEERLALFEQITLPAIRAQTDPDFLLIVVISADMPTPYLKRLAAMLSDIPQVALMPMEPMDMREAMKSVVAQFKDPAADVIAHFRLDDDDAVAVDFIERLRAGFAHHSAAFDHAGRLAIDFRNGFALSTTPNATLIQQVTRSLWTPALAVFLRPKSNGNALTFSHLHLAKHMPVIADQHALMFIRTANQFNDSKRWLSQLMLQPITANQIRKLQGRFNVKAGNLSASIVGT